MLLPLYQGLRLFCAGARQRTTPAAGISWQHRPDPTTRLLALLL